MNQITTRPPGGALPTRYRHPCLSGPLLTAIFCAERNALVQSVPAEVVAEAKRLDAHYAQHCRPAGSPRVMMWLLQLNACLSIPITGESFNVRAKAIAEVLEGLPVAVFTAETQIELAGVQKFFPGAAEVKAFLEPRVRALLGTQRTIAAILAHGTPAPVRPTDPDERDRIVRAFRAQLGAAIPPPRTIDQQLEELGSNRPRASHLTADQLAAVRRPLVA